MFKAINTGRKTKGQVIYEKYDYSFDFKPAQNTDITLMVGYLYLGIDSETMLARQVWGYSPSSSWTRKTLKVPTYFYGDLSLQEEIQAGLPKRLVDSGNWTTYYDSDTGWVCIGDDSFSKNDIAVEFATNTIAVLKEENLKAVWLQPVFL
ncbi:hypothetical protein EG832_18015 [bacterium]|nr:hypothetical protein [bacterium]